MAYNESVEMYLETIYILEQSHGHAHGVDIAKQLGVSKASVTKAMKQLKEKGLVNKETYGSITLTAEGLALSKRIYYNHQMITRYLEHSLNLTTAVAAENACKMEHIIGEEMLTSIHKYLSDNEITVTEI